MITCGTHVSDPSAPSLSIRQNQKSCVYFVLRGPLKSGVASHFPSQTGRRKLRPSTRLLLGAPGPMPGGLSRPGTRVPNSGVLAAFWLRSGCVLESCSLERGRLVRWWCARRLPALPEGGCRPLQNASAPEIFREFDFFCWGAFCCVLGSLRSQNTAF